MLSHWKALKKACNELNIFKISESRISNHCICSMLWKVLLSHFLKIGNRSIYSHLMLDMKFEGKQSRKCRSETGGLTRAEYGSSILLNDDFFLCCL